MNRRSFLKMLGAGLLGAAGMRQIAAYDWDAESPAAAQMREHMEWVIGGLNMALDFRCIDALNSELFRIEINASRLLPVASCFKAFAVLYYFMNTPQDEWRHDAGTPLYSMAVYSNNQTTGEILAEVAARVPGRGNAIVKFNDFLHKTVGLTNGLYSWNWEGSPTAGMEDPRYRPSSQRAVWVKGTPYEVENVFTASDLGRGHDFITRGEFFSQSPAFKAAARATKALLSIPADNGYRSPIERVFPAGYTGKDGILQARDFDAGQVIDDAGVLYVGSRRYLVAFMSAGESESTAIYVLSEIIRQMDFYEAALNA